MTPQISMRRYRLRATGRHRSGTRRQAALAAGLPQGVGCMTINKVCGSGMQAAMLAHDLIRAARPISYLPVAWNR